MKKGKGHRQSFFLYFMFVLTFEFEKILFKRNFRSQNFLQKEKNCFRFSTKEKFLQRDFFSQRGRKNSKNSLNLQTIFLERQMKWMGATVTAS